LQSLLAEKHQASNGQTMIEQANSAGLGLYGDNAAARAPGKVLKMVTNDRMAGSIPSWQAPVSAQDQIAQGLGAAQNGLAEASFKDTLAYSNAHAQGIPQTEEFGFGDLVDMINPLHHIPLVGYAYREITGDEIKSVSKIIGGGVFGGPVGAAAGLVDAAITAETGDDIAGNAVNLALNGEISARAPATSASDDPETRLSAALQPAPAANDLPVNLLAFAAPINQSEIRIERTGANSTIGNVDAGWKIAAQLEAAHNREPISRVAIATIPESGRYNG
jgi:hypothetical protein